MTAPRLTYVELFAGAGGLSLGLEAAGFHPIAHCEIEPNARAVLRYRWPAVRLDGDVTQVNGADFKGVTLISGGSPCQDLSVAGKRKGLAGERSGLFHQQVRIWQESEAPYLIWENVLGALSSNNGRDFGTVLSTLVGATLPVPSDGWRGGGVAAGPDAVAAWRVLDLQHFGPPQRRVRVFVVAARTGGVDPAEVLAVGEGLCRHPSPRQQQRQGAASRTGTGAPSRSGVAAFDIYNQAASEIAPTLYQSPQTIAFNWQNGGGYGEANIGLGITEEGTGPLSKSQVMAVTQPAVVCTTGDVPHALTHEGADASEDGTGRVTPVIVGTLTVGGRDKGAGDSYDNTPITVQKPASAWPKEIADTLTVAYAEKWGLEDQHINSGAGLYQPTLTGRPRRLTPLECERLMSWPDQWTATGIKEDGTQYALSDTARYRLCGNGVGSVCVAWFAQRLADAMQASTTTQP